MNEMKSNGQFSKLRLSCFLFLYDDGVDAYWENNIQYNLSTLSLFK